MGFCAGHYRSSLCVAWHYAAKIHIFYAAFLSAYAFFLFATKMHERYTLLILPFLLLASIQQRVLTKWYIVISVLSFINLYFSWPVPKVQAVDTVLHMPVTLIMFSYINIYLFFTCSKEAHDILLQFKN
ncbi:MAG: hypothetical protein UZ22_OP11002000350 [Microgenomates bacterium OLB23]|nr:MAG: hypothetical protein UZ22_OP11002000350 [Microgenomates bacterium OLB23]